MSAVNSCFSVFFTKFYETVRAWVVLDKKALAPVVFIFTTKVLEIYERNEQIIL